MTLVQSANGLMPESLQMQPSGPAVLPVKLSESQVRPMAYRILSKKHGLNLKSSALKVVTEFLGRHFGVDWRTSKAERLLDQVAKLWKEQDLGLFVEGDALAGVIRQVLNITRSTHSVTTDILTVDSLTKTVDNSVEMMEVDTAVSIKPAERPFKWTDYVFVVNAQDQPYFHYSPQKRHFEQVQNQKPKILSNAQALIDLFVTRYNIIHDRIFRNEHFQTPTYEASMTKNASKTTYSITMIKNMVGRNNSRFMLFGLLAKGVDGDWWLQDTSGKIKLILHAENISLAESTYYCIGSFILCEGIFINQEFEVISLSPPPSERREITKEAYGNVDFLGLYDRQSSVASSRLDRIDVNFEKRLAQKETELTEHSILILGIGLYLDELKTLDALRKVFTKITDEVSSQIRARLPVAIIFLGSFISSPFTTDGSSTKYKEGWDFLAQLLIDFPDIISECKLIFVPGDNDPYASTFSSGATPTWPLNPVPNVFTTRMKRAVPDAIWASNPTKLAYLSQEISIVRDDYGGRFRRNSLILPRSPEQKVRENSNTQHYELTEDEELVDDEITSSQRALSSLLQQNKVSIKKRTTPYLAPEVAEARKIVRSILDQSHLSPFPLSIRPVAWSFDHALRLAPLPSVLIVGDSSSPMFKVTYEGCHVINPGPFIYRNRINWTEYTPSTKTSEHRFAYL